MVKCSSYTNFCAGKKCVQGTFTHIHPSLGHITHVSNDESVFLLNSPSSLEYNNRRKHELKDSVVQYHRKLFLNLKEKNSHKRGKKTG